MQNTVYLLRHVLNSQKREILSKQTLETIRVFEECSYFIKYKRVSIFMPGLSSKNPRARPIGAVVQSILFYTELWYFFLEIATTFVFSAAVET